MTDLRHLRNQYEGERVFLIGNGPSLSETPLHLLSDEYTIGMNKINSIYGETSWRPSFYVVSWSERKIKREMNTHSDEFVKENIKLDIPCFLYEGNEERYGTKENIHYFDKHSWNVHHENKLYHAEGTEVDEWNAETCEQFWSYDVDEVVYIYHIMYAAAQIAVYLGFDELYFVGCDLGYEYQNPHMMFENGRDPYKYGSARSFVSDSFRERELLSSLSNAVLYLSIRAGLRPVNMALIYLLDFEDTDHFSSDYMLRVIDRREDEKHIIKSHKLIKKICMQNEINVYNATVGGELEEYERVDITELINK
jgi:hypothetical protein